jgi:prostaglandin reductase 1
MNEFGRISICGAISGYNAQDEYVFKNANTMEILKRQLKIEGFIVTRWLSEWPKAFKEMAQWISEGKLQYREKVYEGFDSIYDAFMCLFQGGNIGKVVVKV